MNLTKKEAVTALAAEMQRMAALEQRKAAIHAEHQTRRVAAATVLQAHFRGRAGRATYRQLVAVDQARKAKQDAVDKERR